MCQYRRVNINQVRNSLLRISSNLFRYIKFYNILANELLQSFGALDVF